LIQKLLNKQDTYPSAIPNGAHSSETLFSGVFENLPIISGYSGLLQSVKGSADPHLNALSKHLSSAAGDVSWHKSEKHEDRTREGFLLPSARNIGSKSKRLLIDSQDALELKLTWEEAQDLLYPPPTLKPSILMIEDHEFEEYDVSDFNEVFNQCVVINFASFFHAIGIFSFSNLREF
jgi:hypothetical protein